MRETIASLPGIVPKILFYAGAAELFISVLVKLYILIKERKLSRKQYRRKNACFVFFMVIGLIGLFSGWIFSSESTLSAIDLVTTFIIPKT